jgi:hypothetical protein
MTIVWANGEPKRSIAVRTKTPLRHICNNSTLGNCNGIILGWIGMGRHGLVLHGNESYIVETENDFPVVVVGALFVHILSKAEIDCRRGERNTVSYLFVKRFGI